MSEWKRIFDQNRAIPPPNQTARLAQAQSQAFRLVLKRLDGLQLTQAEDVRPDRFELHVSLFDNNLHRFFGRTWKSKPHQATKRNQEQPSKVHFNEACQTGKMDKRKDLSDFEKGHVVMGRRLGQSISKNTALLGCSRSAVVSVYQKCSKEGTVVNQRQGHMRPEAH
ncbi:nephrocystin-4-like [Silurus meridionalis]|nr:nephrocystin-4-like [Silurus meridionalis]